MNCSKILSGIFLGMFLMVNAQDGNSQKKLLASAERPGVIAKKLGPNTVVYRYPASTIRSTVRKESQNTSVEKNLDTYEYPTMRSQQGAVLPFEIIFDGSYSHKEGVKAQENYYKNLVIKPELNNIIYQDLQTTRERLNAAGIYDAQDLKSFGMPLIAKIVGAGVLITAKITVENKKVSASDSGKKAATKEYKTKVIFKIYDKIGRTVFTRIEAPYATTTKDSYETSLEYILKQTPYYHQQ